MRDYPVPEFSMVPSQKGGSQQGNRPALINVRTSLTTASARNGLGFIAKALLTPGSKVLLPAYHCPALVEPFIWAQCDVIFYPLNRDLSPDINMLKEKLPQAKAIVLVPFFGISHDIEKYVELARQHNCLAIEDLAHAAHKSILHGDYGVTSLQKFYPVSGGGELLIAGPSVDDRVLQLWEREKICHWRWTALDIFSKLQRRVSGTARSGAANGRQFIYFDPSTLGEPMSGKDIRQISMHDHERIAQSRRENYRKLDACLSSSSLGQPLFSNLDANDVPYVYPFILKKAEYFDLIRNMAIPLYRWEEICPSGCDTTDAYRSQLVQFPCHQDLTGDDMARLTSKLEKLPGAIH